MRRLAWFYVALLFSRDYYWHAIMPLCRETDKKTNLLRAAFASFILRGPIISASRIICFKSVCRLEGLNRPRSSSDPVRSSLHNWYHLTLLYLSCDMSNCWQLKEPISIVCQYISTRGLVMRGNRCGTITQK